LILQRFPAKTEGQWNIMLKKKSMSEVLLTLSLSALSTPGEKPVR
jgi:hypothetical protein